MCCRTTIIIFLCFKIESCFFLSFLVWVSFLLLLLYSGRTRTACGRPGHATATIVIIIIIIGSGGVGAAFPLRDPHQLRAEKRDALREIDQLVVVGVDQVQQRAHLLIGLGRVHHADKVAELKLVDDAVAVAVDLTEQPHEAGQEALVALELEAEQDAQELAVRQRRRRLGGLLLQGCAASGRALLLAAGVVVLAQHLLDAHDDRDGVLGVVHVLDDVDPLVLQHAAAEALAQHREDVLVALQRVLALQVHAQQLVHRLLELPLHEAELLVDLVAEDLAEDSNVVVVGAVLAHALDDGRGPVEDEVLQTVLLVEVRVHVLLHGLARQVRLAALDIELGLRRVDVLDDVLQLSQGEALADAHGRRLGPGGRGRGAGAAGGARLRHGRRAATASAASVRVGRRRHLWGAVRHHGCTAGGAGVLLLAHTGGELLVLGPEPAQLFRQSLALGLEVAALRLQLLLCSEGSGGRGAVVAVVAGVAVRLVELDHELLHLLDRVLHVRAHDLELAVLVELHVLDEAVVALQQAVVCLLDSVQHVAEVGVEAVRRARDLVEAVLVHDLLGLEDLRLLAEGVVLAAQQRVQVRNDVACVVLELGLVSDAPADAVGSLVQPLHLRHVVGVPARLRGEGRGAGGRGAALLGLGLLLWLLGTIPVTQRRHIVVVVRQLRGRLLLLLLLLMRWWQRGSWGRGGVRGAATTFCERGAVERLEGRERHDDLVLVGLQRKVDAEVLQAAEAEQTADDCLQALHGVAADVEVLEATQCGHVVRQRREVVVCERQSAQSRQLCEQGHQRHERVNAVAVEREGIGHRVRRDNLLDLLLDFGEV
eukprot:PhM_4_TR16122/c8_g1_i1/m.101358